MEKLQVEGSDDQVQSLVAAAHELKTPLTIIAHLASVLEDDSFELSEQEKRISLQRIQLSAERTLRLVQSLTTSYRLCTGDQLVARLNLEPINATQICQEVAHEISPLAQQQQQTIAMQLGTKQQLVVANKELLQSVFFNLLDNAIRHNPPKTEVKIGMRRRAEMVRVCVQDNGPGLSPHDFTTLQERLGRQLQPLLHRSSGSGLGLYIAGQLAAAMGGRLGLGRTAHGADFHVDLLCSKQLTLL